MNNNSNKNEIPSRKGVHLRTPTSSAKNSKTSSTPKQNNNQQAVKKNTLQAKNINNKKNYVTQKSTPKSKNASHKTPAEIARERELAECNKKLALQKQKEKKLKKARRQQEKTIRLIQAKNNLKSIFKNIIIGICIALFLFIFIAFFYYRSLSSYTETKEVYIIELYKYIDVSSDDTETKKLIEERENGKEAPVLTLSESLKLKDGSIYLPFSAISDYFGLTVSGDSKSRTLIIGNSQSQYSEKDTAVFYFDSSTVQINGAKQTLSSSAFMESGELYIPYEFFETYVKGIDIADSKNGTKTNIRIVKSSPAIYFTSTNNAPLDTPNIDDYTPSSESRYNYSIDLSDYEQYINPKDADAYLFLVNNENKLSADYVPEDLTDVIYTRNDRATQQMRLDAAKSLEAFLKAAYANGHSDITVTSAYRSYAYQSSLFNTRLEQNKKTYGAELAEAKTAEFTAYPGSSEHQSGLCCDMHNLPSAMQSFANTEAYKWLYEHCADFGFILRYPQSKEEVTGIKYEPWHYRFVGRYHAQKIMDSGLSLEEYVANLNAGNS